MPHSANFRASVYMLLAMGTFTFGDSITKYLSEEMGVGQYIFLRGLFATTLIGLFALKKGALFHPSLDGKTIIRVLSEVFASVSYIYSLAHLSQAFCSAVFQANPLVVTLGAALFLREKVGWRRWLCIIIGLMGVLIIIRPGASGSESLLAITILLASIIFAASRDLVTRQISPQVPALYISTLTAAVITITGAILIKPMGGWQPLSLTAIAITAIAALLLIVGYHFIILAMREGEVSFVSPFRYSSLLWAMILSTLVFQQAPDFYTIVGALIIVASGIYMVYRESVLKKMAEAKSTLATIPTGVDPS
ncbi:DMT family transporter [Daeguia caeni]|uniref:DMT family transporter n=2 Tax=Daeguia caeni TaxID=439612 RepID=A0ABV9H320_9HYPH